MTHIKDCLRPEDLESIQQNEDTEEWRNARAALKGARLDSSRDGGR